ncbi:uncharacterized protein LOC119975237 isoform X2 [Scyliorhinus canicula]|uniref:uncharacterized protein LOC119975237 isoform X2 n=1 Tax=Scyliorhinus canicula TaxID=7830 RepID=UPI0018F75AA7|nr:uncharacterized protein LOC119975237 isoform X2 [Scyliorhinus canicula]
MFGKLREKSEEDQATTEASGIIGGDPEDSRNPRLDWEKIEAFAAGGDSVPLRKTKPLLLEFGPHQLMASIWVLAACGDPPEGGHDLVPSEEVYVKKLQKEPLGSKWEGPFVILLTTQSAVKLKGKKSWIYASHVKCAYK